MKSPPTPGATLPVYGFIGEGGVARMEHLDREQPCDDKGLYWQGSFSKPAWTPRGFLIRGDRFILACACGHSADAPLQKLVDAGEGDLPLHLFSGRWACAKCGGREITPNLDLRP